MALKDLTAFLTPDLKIPYKGKTYTVPPPSKDNLVKLGAINALGVATYAASLANCPTCGRTGKPDLPEDTQRLVEELGRDDVEVATISLSRAVYDEMIADEVPGPHIDQFGVYALYYWTMGEATADAIFAAQQGADALGEAVGPARKGTGRTSTQKPGRRTASVNQTPGASFRRTAAPRKR